MTYTIKEVMERTGYPKSLIDKKIFLDKITLVNRKISEESMTKILDEKTKFISLREFAISHSSDTFNGRSSADRKKLLEYFERNNFFSMRTFTYEEILMGEKPDVIFFLRRELEAHEADILPFFGTVNVPEEEKVRKMMLSSKDHSVTLSLLYEYLDYSFREHSVTPCVTQFVGTLLEMPDLPDIDDKELKKSFKAGMSVRARNHLVSFLDFARSRENVQYSRMEIRKERGEGEPAYPDDIYLVIIHCIFNAGHIHTHQMIEKALDHYLYCEMWLYLALHMTCAWRAGDICTAWKYIHLSEREPEFLGINSETLYEDLLNDNIPDETYEAVCDYALVSVDLSGRMPSKTASCGPSALKAVIMPELKNFFGLLILIAESMMLRTGKGYMCSSRISSYQNRVNLEAFFGHEMTDALGGENIHTRRLTKAYLQGVEDAARQNGCSSLMVSLIASYARNHTSMDTVSFYLRDHALTGETAEMLVYYMLERGVFGFEAYQTLLCRYPEIMRELPMKMQNKLLAQLDINPFRIETEQSELLVQMNVHDQFLSGNDEYVMQVFRDMLAVTQGFGKAKDEGIHCLFRLRGQACPHPAYRSCLANGCRHLIFTRLGLIPLIEVMKEYYSRAKTDLKSRAVLKNVLQPRFRDLLNYAMQTSGMNKAERAGIKKILEEELNG